MIVVEIACLVCIVVSLWLVSRIWRVGLRGEVVILGKKAIIDPTLHVEYVQILRVHCNAAFWAMLGSGLMASVLLFLTVLLVLFGSSVSGYTWILSTITGFGDTALFGYFLRIWRECTERYSKEVGK